VPAGLTSAPMPRTAGQSNDGLFISHNCERDPNNSPFRVAIANKTSTGQGSVYCFNFYVVPCLNRTSGCCDTNIYKMEMPVRECHQLGSGERGHKKGSSERTMGSGRMSKRQWAG
jgi:hypothetical protein